LRNIGITNISEEKHFSYGNPELNFELIIVSSYFFWSWDEMWPCHAFVKYIHLTDAWKRQSGLIVKTRVTWLLWTEQVWRVQRFTSYFFKLQVQRNAKP